MTKKESKQDLALLLLLMEALEVRGGRRTNKRLLEIIKLLGGK